MRREAGFSLLEMIAVLAIFAVVALIGVQVIGAAARSSDRLTHESNEAASLAMALALLRQDLEGAVPLTFTAADGAEDPALAATAGGFSLSVGGLARLGGDRTGGLGRVDWMVDTQGRLMRRVWTSRHPGARQAAVAVPVLQGVAGLRLSSYRAGNGWRAGYDADPRKPEALPEGLRVVLDIAGLGEVDTLVSLR